MWITDRILERIDCCAHDIFVNAGCPDGREWEHRFLAERWVRDMGPTSIMKPLDFVNRVRKSAFARSRGGLDENPLDNLMLEWVSDIRQCRHNAPSQCRKAWIYFHDPWAVEKFDDFAPALAAKMTRAASYPTTVVTVDGNWGAESELPSQSEQVYHLYLLQVARKVGLERYDRLLRFLSNGRTNVLFRCDTATLERTQDKRWWANHVPAQIEALAYAAQIDRYA